MSLETDLNLDIDIDQAERGHSVPEGWYLAVVEDAQESPDQNGTLILTYLVEGGDFDGVKVYDRLYDPANAKDTDGAKACDNRRAIYAKRLGLVVRENPADPKSRYRVNLEKCPTGRVDWEAAIGQRVALKMTARTSRTTRPGSGGRRTRPRWTSPGCSRAITRTCLRRSGRGARRTRRWGWMSG